ncbi:uncharacterized protein EAE98_005219 [Botrytis deweyae]|uniref:Uncharacterized protein n=1 Tax=Botrytis deweyae TaxID=2478750 RepID=A0ABQ7INA1_9HELO|nr:uncharacterized protein EAE98_005219 [Botrytis deweyae]KAF7929300.1 hypothetical protein EAE98_005219 [Botrytis deweyae]
MKLHTILVATLSSSAFAAPLVNKDSTGKRTSPVPPLMDAGIDSSFVEKRASPAPPLIDTGIDFDFVEKRVSARPPLIDAGIDLDFVE